MPGITADTASNDSAKRIAFCAGVASGRIVEHRPQQPDGFGPAGPHLGAVPPPMIRGREGVRRADPAAEEPRRQRRADDHADALRTAGLEQPVAQRAEIAEVEVHLQKRRVIAGDEQQRLVGRRGRDAERADGPLAPHRVERREQPVVALQGFLRRAVQLQQIDVVGLQPLQAAVERAADRVGREVLPAVRAHVAGLGRQHHVAAARAQTPARAAPRRVPSRTGSTCRRGCSRAHGPRPAPRATPRRRSVRSPACRWRRRRSPRSRSRFPRPGCRSPREAVCSRQ